MYRGNLSGPSSNMEATTAVGLADVMNLWLWACLHDCGSLKDTCRPCT
jgi:hypothetical protein